MSPAAQGDPILVDTSAWIGFFARTGYSELKTRLKKLLDDDRVATAGPIVLELLQGCRSKEERTQLDRRLRALHWLAIEDRLWFMAGETSFTLRREGITISAIDALIATLAETYDCALLHLDSDFDQIARHTRLRLVRVGLS
jgi:predicted nucleic acid-binding protein